MDIGVFHILPDDRADPAIIAAKAEALGFESYWVGEHPVYPVVTTTPYIGGPPDAPPPDFLLHMADPFITLARASATTSRLKLGTGVCLVPQRDPLVMGLQIASLDNLCGGRFEFGIGAGWNKEECEIMGGDFAHRWTQTREHVEAMKLLWTEDEAEYHGTYVDFPKVVCQPKPASKPHPPIIMGGTLVSDAALKRVVDWCDGWMPIFADADAFADAVTQVRTAAEAADRDPGTIHLTAFNREGQWHTADHMRELELAGADRTLVWIHSRYTDEILVELEAYAKEVL